MKYILRYRVISIKFYVVERSLKFLFLVFNIEIRLFLLVNFVELSLVKLFLIFFRK